MSIEHLFTASIGLAVFIIALILGKRNKSISDGFLVFWLLIFITNFASLFLLNVGYDKFNNWELLVFEFSEASIFLHGPILYFYTISLTKIPFKLKKRYLVHAVPFLLAFSILFKGILLENETTIGLRNILLLGKMLNLLFYVVYVLKILYLHKKTIEDIFSNTEEKRLNWLFFINWGILIVWFISVGSLLLFRFNFIEIPQYGGLITNISISIFLFVMGYFGVKQPSVFLDIYENETNETQTKPQLLKNKTKNKYEKSGLSADSALSYHQTLTNYMEVEKPFLDTELTLYSLAKQLNWQANHLSQVINSIEKNNFFEFINKYRIEEAKRKIKSENSNHLTLLGVGYESGFNSKTSFNRAFKKHVGCTPSEFKVRTV